MVTDEPFDNHFKVSSSFLVMLRWREGLLFFRIEVVLAWMKFADSIREPNAINEHNYIPDIYKALGNPKWRFCSSFKALIHIRSLFNAVVYML